MVEFLADLSMLAAGTGITLTAASRPAKYIIYLKYYTAFCHNRALREIYPDSHRLLFTTGSFTLTASPLSSEPDAQRVQRVRTEG